MFPALALGLSGFETGVVVMPLVKGDAADTVAEPTGRIRNARKLLTTAALIMSVMLMGSAIVTTFLIPAAEFEPGGEANGRALAYLAHENLGEGFGTVYDIATIGILWFAGASAMAGLLNIVPRYLPRYGMAPDWARATRPLVLVFTLISVVVTIAFKADVDAQAGAYATGVLALMTSAAVAVTLTEWRRGHRGAGAFFGVVAAVFIYTITVTILDRPEGLVIAFIFIAMIVVISLVSRISRSTELRVQKVTFDDAAQELLDEVLVKNAPVRFIANKIQAGDHAEYHEKSLDVRLDNHLDTAETAVFLEVEVNDASDFATTVEVTAARVGHHRVLRATGPSVPNVLAAVLLAVSEQDDMPSHIYFEWSEKGPGQNALRFLLAGEGDVPPLTHEILRRPSPTPTSGPSSTSEADRSCSTCGSPRRPHLTDEVVAVFTDDPAVSHLAVLRGASLQPAGDIVLADVAREAANETHRPARRPRRPRARHHPHRTGHHLGLPGRIRRRTPHPRLQRRRRRVGRRHPTRLRGVRAQLDLPVVHDPRDPARRPSPSSWTPRSSSSAPWCSARSSSPSPPSASRSCGDAAPCSARRPHPVRRVRGRHHRSPPSPPSPPAPSAGSSPRT